ncbi:MAG: protein BatD [Candidatus Competibacteraceae bacterium]|nr:protein BatD [Candidatus Competibacteraceae bacterium]
MKNWLSILLLSLAQILWVYPALAAQEINAFVDQNTVVEGETLRLIIEVSERNSSSDPDLSPLSKDFQVLGTVSNNQVSIVNGAVNAKTRWVVTLAPQRSGTLTIPAITVGQQQTLPITLQVAKAGATSADGATPDLFIETEVKPDAPYVQQQVTYVVRIYYAVNPREPQLTDPKAADALIERLGDDRQYQTQRGNRRYGVLERRYAIFPQTSGALTIESPVFAAQVPDNRSSASHDPFFGAGNGFFDSGPFNSLFQTTRLAQVHGQPIEINIKARPPQSGVGPWLPAANLTLNETWSPDPPKFQVGEPVTRTLTLQARGLTGAQLPELPLPAAQNPLKFYPDQPATETQSDATAILGKREQKIALVPTNPGNFLLPEIRIPWWDTQTHQMREAVAPARKITVSGAPASAQQTPAQATLAQAPLANSKPQTQESPPPAVQKTPPQPAAISSIPPVAAPVTATYWPWIALAFLLAWIATLILWWKTRREAARAVSLSGDAQERSALALSQQQALRALKQACQANDAARIKSALLHWARLRWPENPPRSLLNVAEHINHDEARQALQQFDRWLYRETGETWDGNAFYRQISAIFDMRTDRIKSGLKGSVLPELYPA